MKNTDDIDFEDLGANSDARLLQLAQRRKLLLPTVFLGLAGTALIWFFVLRFPEAASGLLSGLLNTNHHAGHSGAASLIIMAIPFILPFASVFALGNLLFPKLEEGPEIESGVMSGFSYEQKSDKRWHIFIAAGMCGALNCILVFVVLVG